MDNYFDSLKSLHVITYAHRTYKIIAVCFACASYSEFIDLILHCLMFHSLNYFYLYRQTYSNISQQHRELLFNMNRSKGCFRVLSWTSRPADDQSLSDLHTCCWSPSAPYTTYASHHEILSRDYQDKRLP